LFSPEKMEKTKTAHEKKAATVSIEHPECSLLIQAQQKNSFIVMQ